MSTKSATKTATIILMGECFEPRLALFSLVSDETFFLSSDLFHSRPNLALVAIFRRDRTRPLATKAEQQEKSGFAASGWRNRPQRRGGRDGGYYHVVLLRIVRELQPGVESRERQREEDEGRWQMVEVNIEAVKWAIIPGVGHQTDQLHFLSQETQIGISLIIIIIILVSKLSSYQEKNNN